jgi:hypothetical protein
MTQNYMGSVTYSQEKRSETNLKGPKVLELINKVFKVITRTFLNEVEDRPEKERKA